MRITRKIFKTLRKKELSEKDAIRPEFLKYIRRVRSLNMDGGSSCTGCGNCGSCSGCSGGGGGCASCGGGGCGR